VQLEIRKATIADIDKIISNRMEFISKIGEIVSPEQFIANTYDYIQKHLEDGTFIAWLAIEKDEIVSIVIINIYTVIPTIKNLSGKSVYLINVYTHENYQRKGLATQLLKNTIAEAKALGVNRIYLEATAQGKFVYDKLGFELLENQMALNI